MLKKAGQALENMKSNAILEQYVAGSIPVSRSSSFSGV